MAVTRRTLAEVLAQKGVIKAVGDERQRQLVAAWVRAWDQINADMLATIEQMMVEAANGPASATRAARLRRQRKALRIASEQVIGLCQMAGVQISRDAQALILRAAGDQQRLVASQLHPSMRVTFERVDPVQLRQMVQRTTEQITARTYHLQAEATAAMKRELALSTAIGDNPKQAAARMLEAVQGAFNGGLTRALVIARTEQIDAYRRAAQAWQDTNSDILAGWQWIATLGPRTCPSCIAHHGEMHKLSEPGPLDHHQGRCARMPVTKSWKDLGFTGIQEPPPAIRAGDGERWFNRQPADVQQQVMGPKRFEAWKRGDYPAEDWSQRRETADWRPSYGVGPVSSRDGS